MTTTPPLRPTEATHAPHGGYTSSEMERRFHTWAASQPLITRCDLCDWKHAGSAQEGREAAREHRLSAHPERCGKRKGRRGSPIRFVVDNDPEIKAEMTRKAEEIAARWQA